MVGPADKVPPFPPPGAGGPGPAGGGPSPQFNTPFMKMFPSGATPQELQAFLNNFLKMMIFEFKQSDQAWQRGQDQIKKAIEGDED